MLGNTANGLFWTYRFLERAENMSRLIETGQRIALTRLSSSDEQWLYVMQTSAVSEEYKNQYSKVEKENQWLLCSEDVIVWVIGKRVDQRYAAPDNFNLPLIITAL